VVNIVASGQPCRPQQVQVQLSGDRVTNVLEVPSGGWGFVLGGERKETSSRHRKVEDKEGWGHSSGCGNGGCRLQQNEIGRSSTRTYRNRTWSFVVCKTAKATLFPTKENVIFSRHFHLEERVNTLAVVVRRVGVSSNIWRTHFKSGSCGARLPRCFPLALASGSATSAH
jgi:hypothetical protein